MPKTKTPRFYRMDMNGNIYITKPIRDELKIYPGDYVDVTTDGNKIVIEKIPLPKKKS